MAQPSEARAASNARVGTIQKWLVGVAIGCMTIGFIALLVAAYQWHELQHSGAWVFIGLGSLFMGFGWVTLYVGRGLLMYLRPRDVQGQLRSATERTGHPRLYGLAMMWSGICFVLGLWILDIHNYQVFQNPALNMQDDSAVYNAFFGLLVASALPLLLLEAYGWWRHIQHRMAE